MHKTVGMRVKDRHPVSANGHNLRVPDLMHFAIR